MALRLHTRLTIAFAVLLLVLGGLLAAAVARIAERYSAEVSQRLNASIAMYVTQELALLDSRGLNETALEELARRVMTVNPSAEVYVLTPEGRVLTSLQPRQRIVQESVDLRPIRRFLDGYEEWPLYGDDPSGQDRSEVFSVAAIRTGDGIAGYLYVVLGSARFDSVVAAVRGNYSLQLGLISAAGVLCAALILGAALFVRLTLPLRRLARRMAEWAAKLGVSTVETISARDGKDEIALLSSQFESMGARIEQQVQEIKDRDAARRELIANVSHDLRTPLASLRGYLETVLVKGDALHLSMRSEYLQVACRHARQLECRIASFFELSRLESGGVVPDYQPFSLGELLQDVALRFRLRAEQRGVAILTHVEPSTPLVSGDVALVERVLENLLENALRYTDVGGRVSLEMRREAEHVLVTVSDTGSGIAVEDLPHVFNRFYRGKAGHEGTGLGLAIVRRIVELHGESVALHSTPGIGTSVEFGLPLAGPIKNSARESMAGRTN